MIRFFIISGLIVVISQMVVRFAKSIRAAISDNKAGKSVHVQTPIGTFDLKAKDALDPELATILVYPGAMRIDSQPTEYEADIQLLGREYRILMATYWTLTPVDVVWEFYKRELPGWQEKRQRGQRRFLTETTADAARSIRVYIHNSETMIETKISLKAKVEAAAAGMSDTSFNTLR